MKSGDIDCPFSVNSNPKVPLDELLRNVMSALCPMQFIVSDAIYAEINNECIEKNSSNFSKSEYLQPIFITQKAKVNIGGTLKIQATTKREVPDSASGGGSPCLQIYLNDKLVKSIYIDTTNYSTNSVEVSVNAGDVISFALYGGIKALNGGGVWVSNTAYLQANSIKILAEVKDTMTDGKIEVSENG